MKHTLQKLLTLLFLFGFTMQSASANTALSDKQLHATLSIITNFLLLSNSPTTSTRSTSSSVTIIGDNPLILKKGTAYQELGATALEGNSSLSVSIASTVNTNIEGQYSVTYSAVDSRNNRIEATRLVEILQLDDADLSFVIDELNLSQEVKDSLTVVGVIEDSNGEVGSIGGLTDVVANQQITYTNSDNEEIIKDVIVYRSFNIGEWVGKLNEETTLLARIFMHPYLVDIAEDKKIEYIAFLKDEYITNYDEALRFQKLSNKSSFFTPQYYDLITTLQNIVLSKYEAEPTSIASAVRKSLKYINQDKFFTNMALMQIKSSDEEIEFSNYADVYYGVRTYRYDGVEQAFDYPMFTTETLHQIDPVKGGAVGGLFDWATNQVPLLYSPTSTIKYNDLLDVSSDITGTHKALIEIYKWKGGLPSLLNTGRGISLILKTVLSGGAGDKFQKGLESLIKKGKDAFAKYESTLHAVDATITVVELGLDILEFANPEVTKEYVQPYRKYLDTGRSALSHAYSVVNVQAYSPDVKSFKEIFQLKQLLGGAIAVVPSNTQNTRTREILQDKIDTIDDKNKEWKVLSTALFLNKVIEPLIKSNQEGKDKIQAFNDKYETIISFSQMAYYIALRKYELIEAREVDEQIIPALLYYGNNFISKSLLSSVKQIFEKYTDNTAQIAKATSKIKEYTNTILKIEDPLQAMKDIGTFLIKGQLVNIKGLAGDAILSIVYKMNPAGATVKAVQAVNDWSSFLVGNLVISNAQYFQVDFDNGVVDISLPPVSFSGIATDAKIKPTSSISQYFEGKTRFLVAVDDVNDNIHHRPKFDMFFTEANQDGILIDGDFEDLLETDAYIGQTIFAFDLNIEKSQNDSEDQDSFVPVATVANNRITSEDIRSADLKAGNNNISYLDIIEAWEKNRGSNLQVVDKYRGIFKESVDVEMMPSLSADFIIDSLKQNSTAYYGYHVHNSDVIRTNLIIWKENDDVLGTVNIKNIGQYPICYDVQYDYEVGLLNDIPKNKFVTCIDAGEAFKDTLDVYKDTEGNLNDIHFYFYDRLAYDFFDNENILKPYIVNYTKLKNMEFKNALLVDRVAFKVILDNLNGVTPLFANVGEDIEMYLGENREINSSYSEALDAMIVLSSWFDTDNTLLSTSPILALNTFGLGEHTITLTVKGLDAVEVSDTVIVTVLEAPLKANAGAYQIKEVGQVITLDASASTGNIQSYEWTFEGNVLGNTATMIVPISMLEGSYTFYLKVSDGITQSVDSVVVNVVPQTSTATSTLKKTAQTTTYTPYDDGHYQKGATPSYSRDDAFGIVTDHVTGLEWQDNESISKPWLTQANYDAGDYSNTSGDTATTYCSNLNLNGGGWRLPTVKELLYIVDNGKFNPNIDSQFQNTISYYYWSSTSYASSPYRAWRVFFGNGSTYGNFKNSSLYVRCVRAGQ